MQIRKEKNYVIHCLTLDVALQLNDSLHSNGSSSLPSAQSFLPSQKT